MELLNLPRYTLLVDDCGDHIAVRFCTRDGVDKGYKPVRIDHAALVALRAMAGNHPGGRDALPR